MIHVTDNDRKEFAKEMAKDLSFAQDFEDEDLRGILLGLSDVKKPSITPAAKTLKEELARRWASYVAENDYMTCSLIEESAELSLKLGMPFDLKKEKEDFARSMMDEYYEAERLLLEFAEARIDQLKQENKNE